MRRLYFAITPLFALAACAQPAPLEVRDVWTRDTVGGTANAALFMTIRSPTPDRLISASTTAARQTDLMTMQTRGGMMEMIYLKGIDVPADKPVSLNPSGLHVWLAELHAPLKAGQRFPLVLTFEKAGQRQVMVAVIAPAAAPPAIAITGQARCPAGSAKLCKIAA